MNVSLLYVGTARRSEVETQRSGSGNLRELVGTGWNEGVISSCEDAAVSFIECGYLPECWDGARVRWWSDGM